MILIYLLLFLFGQNVQDVNSRILRAEVVHQYKSGGKGYIERNSIFIDTLGNVLFDNNELFDDTGYKINWYNPYINKFIIYSDGADTLDRALKQTFIKDIPEIKYGFMDPDGTITPPFFYTYKPLELNRSKYFRKLYEEDENSKEFVSDRRLNRYGLGEIEDYFFEQGTFLAKKSSTGLYGLMDEKGQFILPPQYKSFKPSVHNINWVVGKTDTELHVFDGKGSIVVSLKLPEGNTSDYEFFFRGSLELSRFYFPYTSNKLLNIAGFPEEIDATFAKKPNGKLTSLMLTPHLILIQPKDDYGYYNKFGLADWEGNVIVEPKFSHREIVDDGLGNRAIFGQETRKNPYTGANIWFYHLWDLKGKALIPPQSKYYGADNGKFYFRKDSLYGPTLNYARKHYQVFDIQGNLLKRWRNKDPNKGMSGRFSNGLSRFTIKNKDFPDNSRYSLHGFVNTNEEIVIQPQYATVKSFGVGYSHSYYKKEIFNKHRKNFAETFLYRSDDSEERNLKHKYLQYVDYDESYNVRNIHHYVKTFMNKKGEVIWKPSNGLFYSWQAYPEPDFVEWVVYKYNQWIRSDFVHNNYYSILFVMFLLIILISKIKIPKD